MINKITYSLYLRLTMMLLCLGVSFAAFAQQLKKDKIVAKYNVLPDNYNFWVSTPADYDEHMHRLPLVIFLHGASLCGNDLSKVRRYGVIDAIERGKIIPAITIAPQSKGAWSPKKLNDLLEWMKRNYRVDSTRVYVLGMSLGGYGTMDFCNAYPEKIAAGIAMCGGCSSATPDGLSKLPFWIMHGTADRAVSVEQSKKVVNYLQSKNMTSLLRYDWWIGGNHGVFARCFYLQKTYDWLFSHSLGQKPRKVDRSFNITPEDAKTTYEELKWFKGQFDNE